MKKYTYFKYIFPVLVLSLMIFTVSCGGNKAKQTTNTQAHDHDHDHDHSEGDGHDHSQHADHDHEDGHDHSSGEWVENINPVHDHSTVDLIIITPEQEKMLGVEKIRIQPETFHQVIKCSGEILPAQGEEKTIVSTTNGIINFAKQGITEGMSVNNGEVIFSIHSQNIGDGDVALKARNAYEKEKKEYERAKELIAYKLISEKEFNDIKLRYDNAKLSYNALNSKTVGGGVGVSSPLSGYLKSIMVTDGQYVAIGEPLAIVTQSNKLQLRANVSQKYAQNLPNIQSANIVLPCNNGTYNLSKLNGKVLSYGKSLEKNDFYMPINFSFDNVGNIIPGSIVDVYLLASPKSNAKVVPLTALLEVQGDYFVIVNLHEDEFQERRVILGESDGQNVEIVEGLKDGEIVVSKGGYLVKQAKSAAAIPHGHSH